MPYAANTHVPEGSGLAISGGNCAALGEPDLATLLVLDAAMRQGDQALLPQKIRQQKFSGAVSLINDADLYDGFYYLGVKFDENTEPAQAEKLLRETWASLCEGLDERSLDQAKHCAYAEYFRLWQNLPRRTALLARAALAGRQHQLLHLPEAIEKVSAANLSISAQKLSSQAAYTHSNASGPLSRWQSAPEAGEVFAGVQAAIKAQEENSEAAASRQAALAPLDNRTLSNGLRLSVWKDGSMPIVNLRGYICGGSLLDPPDRPGLTAFSAKLLGLGSGNNPGSDFADSLAKRGMSLTFAGDSQVIVIDGWCLRKDLPQFLELLGEALHYPQPDAALAAQALTEMQLSQNQPSSIGTQAVEAFMAKLYPSAHPFARPAAGTAQDWQKFNVEEATQHLRNFISPDKLILSFSGQVSMDELVEALPAHLLWWPANAPIALPNVPPAQPRAGHYKIAYEGLSALIIAGQLGPERTAERDYEALALLCEILGGQRSSARLPLRIVHLEHLGSSVSCRVLPLSGATPWAVVMQVKPDKVKRAEAVLRQELKRLIERGPEPEEISRAAQVINGRMQAALSLPSARAGYMSTARYYKLSDDWSRRYASHYSNFTTQELRAAAKQWLNPDKLVIISSAP